MALMRSYEPAGNGPKLQGHEVYLRYPEMDDFDAWSQLRAESRDFLEKWEPLWPSDDLTRGAFRRRLKRYAADIRDDLAYPFFIFRDEDGALVGAATLSNVRRGVAQACSLGYWVGERYARRGYTRSAVKALFPFVFDTLQLHRLEAACIPWNEPSKRLLSGAGFTEEGYARQYLKIHGKWQDHLLFAITKDDPWR